MGQIRLRYKRLICNLEQKLYEHVFKIILICSIHIHDEGQGQSVCETSQLKCSFYISSCRSNGTRTNQFKMEHFLIITVNVNRGVRLGRAKNDTMAKTACSGQPKAEKKQQGDGGIIRSFWQKKKKKSRYDYNYTVWDSRTHPSTRKPICLHFQLPFPRLLKSLRFAFCFINIFCA